MASIKKKGERKFKITVSNGYRAGKKMAKAMTITVPQSVPKRGIQQYVAHEAEEFERQVKYGFSEDGEMTFEEYAEKWLSRQTKYAPSTIESYRRMLQRVYPFIGSIKLNRLRPIALENMLIELRKRTFRGKPIQETTVQKYLTTVSAVLADAKRNEIIQRNPARMIDLPDTEQREQFIPSQEQAMHLIEELKKEPAHFFAFYMMAMITGCRRGELCAMKWSDLTLKKKLQYITIQNSRSSVAGLGVVEGKTKNGKTRVIALDYNTTFNLICYGLKKKSQAEERGEELNDYMFCDDNGKLVHPDTFTKHLRKIYDRLGFPKEFHLHTLRHFFVTTLLHNGVDKQTVAELAGHGDTSFLERTYCHPQMDKKIEAAKVMSTKLLVS